MGASFTRITINGRAGLRFLSSLRIGPARYRVAVPRALHWLVTSDARSIDVEPRDADHVAEFVDELRAAGWLTEPDPPLLFSPRVGDRVAVTRELLGEASRTTGVWLGLAKGTCGRLVGWREPRAEGDTRFALIEVAAGAHQGRRVFVREHDLTRASRR